MFITDNHLTRARDEFAKANSFSALNEAVILNTRRKSIYSEISIFLSHKHDESEKLKNAIALLSSIGVKVYVDWMDNTMPTNTSGETAEKLKQKIKENKKFILLATPAAISSKWCNWELGIGDVHKYPNHIALMPIANSDQSWPGNEYLQIYPAITTEYQYSIGSYYVEFKGSKISLVKWLQS